MKSRRKQPYSALQLDLRSPVPTRTPERNTLRDLTNFCLVHDPRALAQPVEHVKETREKVQALQRWFDRYMAALPPGVQ